MDPFLLCGDATFFITKDFIFFHAVCDLFILEVTLRWDILSEHVNLTGTILLLGFRFA